jgi:hypothetical protein
MIEMIKDVHTDVLKFELENLIIISIKSSSLSPLVMSRGYQMNK